MQISAQLRRLAKEIYQVRLSQDLIDRLEDWVFGTTGYVSIIFNNSRNYKDVPLQLVLDTISELEGPLYLKSPTLSLYEKDEIKDLIRRLKSYVPMQ